VAQRCSAQHAAGLPACAHCWCRPVLPPPSQGVGVSGLTLGGGIGHSTRKLGFLVDVVEGATLVTANGTITTASATTNPDLFWVSQRRSWRARGGGA